MHFQAPLSTRISTALMILLFSILLISACVARQPLLPPEELQTAYLNAVRDAAIAEPGEIYRNLTAITASNPDLIWQEEPGRSRVLVVTWTNYEGYKEQIGKPAENPIFCWVTVAPELQTFCQNCKFGPEALSLSLKQLLGLPPEGEKSLFVEMWVDPQDLFRPSPDPEITDHEAELNFPESGQFIKIADKHIQWFLDMKDKSCSENGYPWTRLGYTYDWGNPQSEVGLSEFVIQKGATVLIKSVSTLDEYCR